MPYDVSWYLEERVVYARVSGIFTMKDVCHFNRTLVALVDAGTPPVHVIMHHCGLEKVPTNLRQMRRAFTVLDRDGLGLAVDVAEHTGIWTYVGQMLLRMSRMPFRHVNTMEEAHQILAEYDPSVAEALKAVTDYVQDQNT